MKSSIRKKGKHKSEKFMYEGKEKQIEQGKINHNVLNLQLETNQKGKKIYNFFLKKKKTQLLNVAALSHICGGCKTQFEVNQFRIITVHLYQSEKNN